MRFIAPVDWQEITPALEALKEAGVKIINLDTQVAKMEYVDAYMVQTTTQGNNVERI